LTFTTGVLYVAGEPSIGLHQREQPQAALGRWRGCAIWATPSSWSSTTKKTIRTADYVIDLGPGAGEPWRRGDLSGQRREN